MSAARHSSVRNVALALAALASLVAADAGAGTTTYNLHHRLYHPAFDSSEYSLRGTLHLGPPPASGAGAGLASVHFEPAEDVADDLVVFEESMRGAIAAEEATHEILYQVALERPGDSHERFWDISSVKACHLPAATADALILHLAPGDGAPYAIDYFVSPVPHGGACPPPSVGVSATAAAADFVIKPSTFSNTNVSTKSYTSPPSAALRQPPPLNPQGEVVQPLPEKGLIEKYWMYAIPVLIALVIAPGGEEEKPGAGRAAKDR